MRRETKHLYAFDKFQLDGEKLRLMRDGETIQLPPKAIELLVLLIEYRGQTLEKDFLMERLWQETFVEEANLTQNVYLLRKALGKRADGKPFIETEPKRGYKFTPEVALVTAEESPLVVSKITNIRARITETEIEDDVTEIVQTAEPLPLTPPKKSAIQRQVLTTFSAFAVVIVLAAGIYFSFFGQSPKPNQIKSIAVMPFKTIGTNVQDDFLGLGMADAVITRLGKTEKINVSPTDAVRRYDEKGVNAVEAGRALKTDAVLTGNIQRDGEQTRVSVQLVRVADNQSLWTENFDEKSANIFALQDKISQRLANALTLRLSIDEQKNLIKTPPASVEAYNLYLQGRFYLSKRNPDSVRKAIDCFEQAVRLDRNYAEAYAGLADSYALTASGLPPPERFPKAKSAALRALELNETLAEAHTSLAFILYKSEWNWIESENHFRRAIEINPNYAPAYHWFGEFLGLLGRFDEGIDILREAERLDPLSQPIKSDLGRILYRARRYDEAIAYARKTLDLDPNYRNAQATILYANEMQQNYPEAVEGSLNYLRLSGYPEAELEQLKAAFASGGWHNYWREQLKMREGQKRSEYLQAYTLAEIYLRIGENDKALEMLEKSFDERGDAPYFVRAEPLLDVLRSNPRFEYLKRRAGF